MVMWWRSSYTRECLIAYQNLLEQIVTLNFFVEKWQPPLPPRKEDMWIQTDPIVSSLTVASIGLH